MTNDEKHIRQLLTKFMDGTTTVDEERAIGRWLREHPTVPDDLAEYRTMFAWFDDGMPLKDGEPDFSDTPSPEQRATVTAPSSKEAEQPATSKPLVYRLGHGKWLLSAVAVAASAAIVLGIFLPGSTRNQGAIRVEKQPVAIVTPHDTVSSDAAVTTPLSADTVKPQINVKERKERRRFHRRMLEPAPPPLLYASADSTVTTGEPKVAEIIAKVNKMAPVTHDAELFIDATLAHMGRTQQAALQSLDEQSTILDDIITATISDDWYETTDDEDVY